MKNAHPDINSFVKLKLKDSFARPGARVALFACIVDGVSRAGRWKCSPVERAAHAKGCEAKAPFKSSKTVDNVQFAERVGDAAQSKAARRVGTGFAQHNVRRRSARIFAKLQGLAFFWNKSAHCSRNIGLRHCGSVGAGSVDEKERRRIQAIAVGPAKSPGARARDGRGI